MTETVKPGVFVHLMDFPIETKEAVTLNEDGTHTIFINAKLSTDAQIEAYNHAIKHIESDDFNKDNVQYIEYYAHKDTAEVIPAKKYINELMRLRRQRAALKKKMINCEKRLNFLEDNIDNINMFDRAENQWLYGNEY